MDNKEQKLKEFAGWLNKRIGDYDGNRCDIKDVHYIIENIKTALEMCWDEALKSQWINVEDSMPPIWENVLVLIECDEDFQVQQSAYFGERVWMFGGSKVIAWMPIPS